MSKTRTVIPSTPFHGPKSTTQQGCCRTAAQNNEKCPLTIPAKNPGARKNAVKTPEQMRTPGRAGR